jgi:pseudaminic acid biosynthesis-associated protein PseG
MIAFRVDGNPQIGIGHIMRCLAVADCMKTNHIEVLFITVDDGWCKSILNEYGFQVISLESSWDYLDLEIEKLIDVIQKREIEQLIVDSYKVTHNYLESLNAVTKVIYIDDMNFFKYPVSTVINYNIYYESFNYGKIYKDTSIELVLGCEFVPLRQEFSRLKPIYRERVAKIMITTGGTDPYNFAGKLLLEIMSKGISKGIEFHLVVGNMNQHFEFLTGLADQFSSVKLHRNEIKMAELMQNCDLAVTAGGTTMYELCACGIPSVSFAFADNQLLGVECFDQSKIIPYVGDVRIDESACVSKAVDVLLFYIRSSEKRKDIQIKMMNMVDGNGAKRIVESISSLKYK